MILVLSFLASAAAADLRIGRTESCIRTEAIDGDNFRCWRTIRDARAINVRLLGIDASERSGHCRPGRKCVYGDWRASMNSLSRGLRTGPVRFTPWAFDRYGRPDSIATAGSFDLSCWQLRNQGAVYWPRYDTGRRVGRTCR